MYQKLTSIFSDILRSGHKFEKDEVLLKFQYRVINTVLLVMALFTLIFAILSSLGIDPLGTIQTVLNYLLVLISIILIVRLRHDKDSYMQNAYLMYAAAFVNFVFALLFVPHDEFRIIWFYLLIFAAYITGGIRAGNIISVLSISVILTANVFYDLHLSQTAIISSVLGLIIASLFIRVYTKKIIDFEQEIIEQNQFLITQSRLAAMGEMMSMVAHQWRQPLSTTTLMIANERLKLMIAGKEPSECHKILDKISDTLVYLSDTIDNFQTYFKPDKASEKISVSTLIERVINLLESRLVISKVQIHVEQDDEDFIDIYVNEVAQALINIINNSIDILSKRKTDDGHIWISVYSNDENVTINIEDNGGGIESDIIDKVFEPYFSSKSKNGTGLGLYMAKMIVNKHIGGVLKVKNTSKGAYFTIVLPKNHSINDLDSSIFH